LPATPSVPDTLKPSGFEASAPAQQARAGFVSPLPTEFDRASQIVKATSINFEELPAGRSEALPLCYW
jgi:hypothetical protein